MKEKLATYVIMNQQTGWTKFWDTLPFWAFIILLVTIGFLYFDKCLKWMEDVIATLDKRMKAIEKRCDELEKTLPEYRRQRDQMALLTRDLDNLRNAVSNINPLGAIVEEQDEMD